MTDKRSEEIVTRYSDILSMPRSNKRMHAHSVSYLGCTLEEIPIAFKTYSAYLKREGKLLDSVNSALLKLFGFMHDFMNYEDADEFNYLQLKLLYEGSLNEREFQRIDELLFGTDQN